MSTFGFAVQQRNKLVRETVTGVSQRPQRVLLLLYCFYDCGAVQRKQVLVVVAERAAVPGNTANLIYPEVSVSLTREITTGSTNLDTMSPEPWVSTRQPEAHNV